MNVPLTNSAAPAPATPAAARSTQYAVGILVAVCALLLGFRYYADRFAPRPTELKQASHRVELNTATRSELMQLPGIGASRADKILAYRASNGGFQRVDDLRCVDGIGDITLQRLKPLIHVDAVDEQTEEPLRLTRKPAERTPSKTTTAKKPIPDAPINLNQASAAELQRLPGIGPTLAQRIVDQRERQPFASVEDLRKVGGIGVKKLEQIRPFVVVRN